MVDELPLSRKLELLATIHPLAASDLLLAAEEIKRLARLDARYQSGHTGNMRQQIGEAVSRAMVLQRPVTELVENVLTIALSARPNREAVADLICCEGKLDITPMPSRKKLDACINREEHLELADAIEHLTQGG